MSALSAYVERDREADGGAAGFVAATIRRLHAPDDGHPPETEDKQVHGMLEIAELLHRSRRSLGRFEHPPARRS